MKCNLDVSFGLPTGTKYLAEHSTGRHCAIGKVIAGCLGRPIRGTLGSYESTYGNSMRDAEAIEIDTFLRLRLGDEKYKEIYNLNDGKWAYDFATESMIKDPGQAGQPNPEAALRLALQYCLEADIIQLEDSELDLVKELKAEFAKRSVSPDDDIELPPAEPVITEPAVKELCHVYFVNI